MKFIFLCLSFLLLQGHEAKKLKKQSVTIQNITVGISCSKNASNKLFKYKEETIELSKLCSKLVKNKSNSDIGPTFVVFDGDVEFNKKENPGYVLEIIDNTDQPFNRKMIVYFQTAWKIKTSEENKESEYLDLRIYFCGKENFGAKLNIDTIMSKTYYPQDLFEVEKHNKQLLSITPSPSQEVIAPNSKESSRLAKLNKSLNNRWQNILSFIRRLKNEKEDPTYVGI